MPGSKEQRLGRFHRARAIYDEVEAGRVYPRWIGDSDCFWYDRKRAGEVEYVLVDAARQSSQLLCTHSTLIRHLGRAEPKFDQPAIEAIRIGGEPLHISFSGAGSAWTFDAATEKLERVGAALGINRSVSPDGKFTVYCKDGNLWLEAGSGGVERPLTTDGSDITPYAVIPMPMRALIPFAPQGCWSPDGKSFLTVQLDERHVEPAYWIEYIPAEGRRPKLHSHPTPLPGDAPIFMRLVIIDVETGAQTAVDHRLVPSRMCDTPFGLGLAWWAPSGTHAYVVDLHDMERAISVVQIDAANGSVRTLLKEKSDTPIELGTSLYGPSMIIPLPADDQIIWYSERTGHGHLYLRDLKTGQNIRAITAGDWQVKEVLRVDRDAREIFLLATGLDPGDPYLTRICRVQIDRDELLDISVQPGLDHIAWRPDEHRLSSRLGGDGVDCADICSVAPSGRFVVQTIGAVDRMPETHLTDGQGKTLTVLEQGKVDLPDWWRWPERIRCKAADGKTDLYGLLWRPMGEALDGPTSLIDIVYGGPQLGIVPTAAFAGDEILNGYTDAAGFAATGAYAFLLDGRGVSGRDKAFRESVVGHLELTSNLEDHVAVIRKLAEQESGIDLSRVGVTGFSGGGFLAAHAALRYGDLYKVSVACSGNYDQSVFWKTWGERYLGAYDPDVYALQAAKTYASGLTGKLMLIHGLMDKGVHPVGMLQLLETLIKAGKDPDVLIMPSAAHEVNDYAWHRILKYFDEYL